MLTPHLPSSHPTYHMAATNSELKVLAEMSMVTAICTPSEEEENYKNARDIAQFFANSLSEEDLKEIQSRVEALLNDEAFSYEDFVASLPAWVHGVTLARFQKKSN